MSTGDGFGTAGDGFGTDGDGFGTDGGDGFAASGERFDTRFSTGGDGGDGNTWASLTSTGTFIGGTGTPPSEEKSTFFRQIGRIFLKNRRFLSVILRLPSTMTWYCRCGNALTIIPVRIHLLG